MRVTDARVTDARVTAMRVGGVNRAQRNSNDRLVPLRSAAEYQRRVFGQGEGSAGVRDQGEGVGVKVLMYSVTAAISSSVMFWTFRFINLLTRSLLR